jgi:hypothetical protein
MGTITKQKDQVDVEALSFHLSWTSASNIWVMEEGKEEMCNVDLISPTLRMKKYHIKQIITSNIPHST